MAGAFSGKHAHSLDSKSRVIIPAPFREKLGDGFTILPNGRFDALAIYPKEKWEAYSERLSRVRETDDTGMDYRLLFMAHAQTDVQMDAQGRILLPLPLRESVGIDKEITFVGALDTIEIWDTAKLAERLSGLRTQLPALSKHVDATYSDKPHPER